MHPSYPSYTTQPEHNLQTPTHFPAAATCCCYCTHHDHQQKQQNENGKTRGGSRSLVYTLPGTSFTRRTKYRLSSLPRGLTRSNHMQQHPRGTANGKYLCVCIYVYICIRIYTFIYILHPPTTLFPPHSLPT